MIHYDHLVNTIEPYYGKGLRVIFLGDQTMNIEDSRPDHNPSQAIEYFGKEMDAVSIDITGENGALNIDLSKPIKKADLIEPADIVADYGTIEHVSNLFNALKNTFNLLKVDGVGIHVNPLQGHFPNHNAFHYFSENFWSEYINIIGLEFIRVFTHPAYHNVKTGMEVYAIYRKTEKSKWPHQKSKEYGELKDLIKREIKTE